MMMRLGDFPSWKNMTADKRLFNQYANQSDALIAKNVHYVSTKGANTFRTNHSVYQVSEFL